MGKIKFIEPELVKAGSDLVRLGKLSLRPNVDCRVISEDGYQLLKQAYDRECARQKDEKSESNCAIPVVVNCTTCAFTDSKYTDETCNKCSRDFDKHEPK